MKKSLLFFLIISLAVIPAGSLFSQMVVSAPIVEKEQKANNFIQKAIHAIEKQNLTTLKDVKSFSEEVAKYTKDFNEALNYASNQIVNAREVKEVVELQKNYIIKHYYYLGLYTNKLQAKYRQPYMALMRNGLKESFNILGELKVVLQPKYYKMSDNERLQLVQDIKRRMNDWYDGMVNYNKGVEQGIALEELAKPKTYEQRAKELGIDLYKKTEVKPQ